MTTAREALHSSLSTEWYTPEKYIRAASLVLKGIDLDPASSAEANKTVNAARYFTEEIDGLTQNWECQSMFLNPPYGRGGQAIWSKRLIIEYEAGVVGEAILLVNSATSEKWFQALWNYPICFTNHRIRFNAPSGKPISPTHGNAFVYFGVDWLKFGMIFENFGHVVLPRGW